MSDDVEIPESLLQRIGVDAGRHLFVPEHFTFAAEPALLDFVRRHPLGQMVSAGDGGLRATAAALIVGEDHGEPGMLLGHLARRNPHAGLVRRGAHAVIVFQGANAYISPRWNRENPSLPTWSYEAVQVRGTFEAFEAPSDARWVLEQTIGHMERDATQPWRLEEAPPELVATLLEHIVAFRFRVTDMQGIRRLNQNRRPADRQGIIDGLRATGAPGAVQIAALMAAGEDAGCA